MGNTLIFHINVLSLPTKKNSLINPAGHQKHATLVYNFFFNFCLELLHCLITSCNHFSVLKKTSKNIFVKLIIIGLIENIPCTMTYDDAIIHVYVISVD